jgi:hypothetical protein
MVEAVLLLILSFLLAVFYARRIRQRFFGDGKGPTPPSREPPGKDPSRRDDRGTGPSGCADHLLVQDSSG